MSASQALSFLHNVHPWERARDVYRQRILGSVSNEEILTRAAEGDISNLRPMYLRRGLEFVRRRMSQTIGAIEREHLGGVNAPEWTIDYHNELRDTLALGVQYLVQNFPAQR